MSEGGTLWGAPLECSCPLGRAAAGAGRLVAAPLTRRFSGSSDLPCFMTVEEMKSLLRLPDVIACAKQNIATAEISARKGTGLTGVLRWLQDAHRTSV